VKEDLLRKLEGVFENFDANRNIYKKEKAMKKLLR